MADPSDRPSGQRVVARARLERSWRPARGVKSAPAKAGSMARPGSAGRLWVLVVLLAAGVALAACAGTSAPGVARLAQQNGRAGSTTTSSGRPAGAAATRPHGGATRLLKEWADCMRGHGVPNQADPTLDA